MIYNCVCPEKSLQMALISDWFIFPHTFDCSAKREFIIVNSEAMNHSEILGNIESQIFKKI